MLNKKLTRRGILKLLAAGCVGGLAACVRALSKVETGDAQNLINKLFLPQISKQAMPTPKPTATTAPPAALQGRVCHIHSNTVTTWTGGTSYWNSVDQLRCDAMVEEGLKKLTGKSTLAQAWQVLIPGYHTGQKIAIKVNFNNSDQCQTNSATIDAIIQPVNSIVRTLVNHYGVNAGDIWVFDAMRSIPQRFTDGSQFAIKFYDRCDNLPAGWSNHQIAFSGINVNEKLTEVITNADYLINIPIVKKHFGAGITLGFKNHFGSIDDPGGLHHTMFTSESGFRTDYSPLVDIYLDEHIRNKTILTIGDGIFGCLLGENQQPTLWSTFGEKVPKSLFFSVDPVAIDSVMADFLISELGDQIPAGATNYLPLAEKAGLGIYEHRDPWSQNYTKINYMKYEIA